jgi:oligo-1,6-glucosidase/alpha-glucosidase
MSATPDLPWWKQTTVYQIYPRSFADTNGDGIGDLAGIVGRLDYLHELGVETLWLSPFFVSPQADFGYDISDHFAVAPEYGSLAEVHDLVRQIHARGMKVVFDMVMNHTSNEHPWFLESKSAKTSPKRDFYLWRDGRKPGGRAPPNNWRSMLGGTGWHYDEGTGQWYWASFLPFQPDLNYRNPEVKALMLGVVRHWLAAGVDGLRLDIFNAIFKDASFADNPFSFRPLPTEDNPHGFFQRHVHTIDHPDTIAFARELRAVVDEFSDPPRFVVGEVFGDAATLRRYCGEHADGLNLVFLFKTLRTHLEEGAVRELIDDFERAFPEPFTPTYVFGNHDRPRFMHRLGDCQQKGKLLATMQLTVRGVPFIYYGEEIGMAHSDIPLVLGLDPVASHYRLVPQWLASYLRNHGILMNRDECRSPMQWHHGPNAGFAHEDATPWLPVHAQHPEVNVAAQDRDAASLLNCYRALLRLRKELAPLRSGRLELIDASRTPRGVLGYRRSLDGAAPVSVFLNFSDRERQLDLGELEGRALFSSRTVTTTPAGSAHLLAPREGAVVFAA